MKMNNNFITIILIITLTLTLVGCGENKTINSIDEVYREDANVNNNTVDEIEQMYTREEFDEKWNTLANEVNSLLDEFYKNPIITDELLSKLYINEQGYAELYESAKNLPNEDYQEVMDLFRLGWIRDGIVTIPYGDNLNYYYCTYKDGVYTINQEYYMTVEWSQNIKEDSEKYAFDRDRKYTVINPEEYAYMLLMTSDGGKRLIRII